MQQIIRDLQDLDYSDFRAKYDPEQTLNLYNALRGLRPVITDTVLFTEDATSVTHTGTLSIPAGCLLLDVMVIPQVLWTDSSAAIIVGDANDPDGFFASTNLAATDLVIGERLQASSDNFWGGKNGAYLTTAGRFGQQSANNIGGIMPTQYDIVGVVAVTTPSGTAGRTYMQVQYVQLSTSASPVLA